MVNYEQITGKVYFAVDPKLPANQIITDIDRAPRNAQGLVEFSADLVRAASRRIRPRATEPRCSKSPIAAARECSACSTWRTAATAHAADLGDPLLFESGYTLVWVGWEFDVPDRHGMMKLYAPVIQGITGPVRSEIMSIKARPPHPWAIASRSLTPSPTGHRHADRARSARLGRAPRSRAISGISTPMRTGVEYPAGFEPGRIYDVVYTGKDPAVVGLGPAAIRDYISYMKQQGEVKRAIGFGTSQSGRFLRKFLYDGFNADEKGKRVFDGVWAHVAGAGRGSFNHRFAQPSRDGHPWLNFLYPTDMFPFTDEPETDGGITDAMLARAKKDGVVPKIFYTNGSYEYWGRAASLIHISPDGKKDVAPRAEHAHLLSSPARSTAPMPSRQERHAKSRQSARLSLRDARAAGGDELLDHRRHRAARFADPAHR